MLYLWLKFLHVISSTILFGTGIGTACTMLYGHYTRDVHVIAAVTQYVVRADWIFTLSSGILQPLTGLWMVYLIGYSFTSFWIMGSIIGYLIAACCWFPVVYLQIKMRQLAIEAKQSHTELSPIYFRYFKFWSCLGVPAFSSLILVFYLMTNKPM
jgi:uncharacterized membrane protein